MSNRKRDKRSITMCGGLNAHAMVANVALEMSNELFEVYARDNGLYKGLRANGQVNEKSAREFFLARLAPKLLEDAREVLASCLAEPDSKVTPHMKEKIHEALVLDNDLRANRMIARDLMATSSGVMH